MNGISGYRKWFFNNRRLEKYKKMLIFNKIGKDLFYIKMSSLDKGMVYGFLENSDVVLVF